MLRSTRLFFLSSAFLCPIACGGSSSTGNDPDATAPADTATTGDTTPGSDSDGGSDVPIETSTEASSDTASGGTSITGSADGSPFTTANMALWLGAPDDPATSVVYVFSKPVKCSDLGSPGWDTRITNGTQFLEMKMLGTTPRTYKVTTSKTPAVGEAVVNYTLSSTSGTPVETAGTGGAVTLMTVNAKANVTGSFALKFGAHDLTGTYDATYCPGGNEP